MPSIKQEIKVLRLQALLWNFKTRQVEVEVSSDSWCSLFSEPSQSLDLSG